MRLDEHSHPRHTNDSMTCVKATLQQPNWNLISLEEDTPGVHHDILNRSEYPNQLVFVICRRALLAYDR